MLTSACGGLGWPCSAALNRLSGCLTSKTCCLPLPMMPKFCAVATAIRPSKKGLNLTEYALKAVRQRPIAPLQPELRSKVA